MLTNAYRLVASDQSLTLTVQQANAWHGLFANTREHELSLGIAWESPELAALVCDDFLWNQHRRTVLLREALVLPREPGLQKIMPPSQGRLFESVAQLPADLLALITEENLLALWLPCGLMPHQHVAVLNLRHPSMARVGLSTRQIMLTRPVQRAAFEPAEPVTSAPQPVLRMPLAPESPPFYAQLAV